MKNQILYWHRNDLRLHDNECLDYAASNYLKVLPVYIYDERQYRNLRLGFRKTSYTRYAYLRDTLAALRERYQKYGGDILILYGKPEELIPALVIKHECEEIVYQEEYMTEEKLVESGLQSNIDSATVRIRPIWGKTLYHRDDIPYTAQNIPLTSKAFRINTSKATKPRDTFATPKQLDFVDVESYGSLDYEKEIGFSDEEMSYSYDADAYRPGEQAALDRLQYYTYDSELLTSYKWTRNRSLGQDYSSQLSPYLSHGSLSPREIYHKVKSYEKDIKKNISTWWLVFEVVWRDYFNFLGLRFGRRVFYQNGYKNKDQEWSEDPDLFHKWCHAETGVPFVDAHMTQLKRTGYMSNRGRVNTSSFLSRDYKIDWRWGAAWFESYLLDYDVCSNWFNWNNQALHLYYTNPVHQSVKYDKATHYISSELEYLNKLPIAYRHAPWLLSDDELAEYGIKTEYKRPHEVYKKWNRSIFNIEKLIDAV